MVNAPSLETIRKTAAELAGKKDPEEQRGLGLTLLGMINDWLANSETNRDYLIRRLRQEHLLLDKTADAGQSGGKILPWNEKMLAQFTLTNIRDGVWRLINFGRKIKFDLSPLDEANTDWLCNFYQRKNK